jgi:hypothetical protein
MKGIIVSWLRRIAGQGPVETFAAAILVLLQDKSRILSLTAGKGRKRRVFC